MNSGISLNEAAFFASDAVMAGALIAALLLGAGVFLAVARPRPVFRGSRAGTRLDRTLGIFLAVLCATAVLIAPMLFILQEGDAIAAIPLLGIRLLQAIVLDNGFVDFIGGLPQGPLAQAYYFLVAIAYVALPVLAALNVYDLVAQRFSTFRARRLMRGLSRKRNVYLFNNFNRRTLSVARGALKNDDQALVIFSAMSKLEQDEWSTEIVQLHPDRAHCLEMSYPEAAAALCRAFKFATLSCFAVSDNAAKDIHDTCQALAILRGAKADENEPCPTFQGEGADDARSRVRLFVSCDSMDDELVLDAANRKSSGEGSSLAPMAEPLQLTVLNEPTMASFALLEAAPLYDVLEDSAPGPEGLRPAEPTCLKVLILGSGRHAEEVLKSVLWCGQMYRVRLEVELADREALKLRDRVLMRCPEIALQDTYQLSFTQVELQSPALDAECLAKYVGCGHLYIVSAVEDDAHSHELAMHARLYFLNHGKGSHVNVSRNPRIACLIRDETMSSLIATQFDEDVPSYGIVPFGCESEVFSYESVVGSPLERAGQRAADLYDLLYNSVDGSLFSGEEISVADLRRCVDAALDAWSSSEDASSTKAPRITCERQIVHYSNLAQALHARYKAWAMCCEELSDEACIAFGENEHNRWTMFYRTRGFTFMSPAEQVLYSRELCGKNTRHKIESLRKHTMLCPNDEIWANYLHAKSGFAYEEPSALPGGNAHLAVSVVDAAGNAIEGIAVQLLDEGYALVEEWVSGASPHRSCGLSPGRYILHPASAMSGRECAADQTLELADELADQRVSLMVEGRGLVNPVIYDWAFAMAAPRLLL